MKKGTTYQSDTFLEQSKDSQFLAPGIIVIKSQDKEYICLFDPDDYELISRYHWTIHSKGYAATTKNGKTILMHRLIMGVMNPDIQVDHIFHNKLDNRRLKLRLCTPSQNRRNSRKLKITAHSEFKGIYFDNNRWHAQIMQNSTVVNLGRYRSEKTAAKVYDIAARHIFKDFAFLNFPEFVEVKQLLIPGL